jgi:hypothetical protein
VFGGDTDRLVRFGAVRSLVEIAARGDAAIRDVVFTGFVQRAEQLKADRTSLGEFRRAIFIRKDNAPPDWVQSVARVLAVLHTNSDTAEEKERWERVAYDLKVAYAD